MINCDKTVNNNKFSLMVEIKSIIIKTPSPERKQKKNEKIK